MRRFLAAPFLLAALTLVPATAPATTPGLVKAMATTTGAAIVHAAVLEERLDAPAVANPGALAAGIADGGYASTLAVLRQTGLALARDLERTRAGLDALDAHGRGLILAMEVELRAVLWALDDLEQTPPANPGQLARLQRTLGYFEEARLAWAEAR